MKRGVAIVLITVFLLNVIGYYGVYLGMIYQANLASEQEIDSRNYDPSQTITFKMKLNVPYPNATTTERASGDFEYGGEFYKMVEQTYENDTLSVVCLKDNRKKHATALYSDIVKQSTGQSSSSRAIASPLKEFKPMTASVLPELPLAAVQIKPLPSPHRRLLSREVPVPTPPPMIFG